MIAYISKNILISEAEALVNTVNTVGIMGKGIALQFREKFPLNYKLYVRACKNNEVRIGKMFVTETGMFTNPKYIINFPTKNNWRESSDLEYISEGLDDLVRVIAEKNIHSITLPPLGCGNGGLDWKVVKPLMEKKLGEISEKVKIEIIEPGHHSYARTTKAEAPPLTKSRAIVLALADKYSVLGFDISHLELQKLAYFMQEMGQSDLKLNYTKGTYGPYATNLKHLLVYLEGYYIKGQIRFQDMKPADPLQLSEDKLGLVRDYLKENLSEEESQRMKEVEALINGFESPYGLELLSTVLWAKKDVGSSNSRHVINYVHNWSERKKSLMKPEQIEIALVRINSFFPKAGLSLQ
jgi:O-acetyl-ADP-ribose deacetylase (regulator of RNase III)